MGRIIRELDALPDADARNRVLHYCAQRCGWRMTGFVAGGKVAPVPEGGPSV